MAIKKKIYKLRGGTVLDIDEFHDGRYGGPGERKREKRSDSGADEGGKPPNEGEKLSEKVDTVFPPGRLLRHTDLCCAQQAEKHEAREEGFSESMEKGEERVLQEGVELFWIRNLEKGTKGAWHIHVVINETGDVAAILQRAWDKGGVYVEALKQNKLYDQRFACWRSTCAKMKTQRKRSRMEQKQSRE